MTQQLELVLSPLNFNQDPILGLSQISGVYSRLDAPLHRTFNTNRIGGYLHSPFSLNRP